ncbi:hypothetical protein HPB47_000412 [Ixodes persulcatus]|uniref:Uncharacterized protein n=1 Tax=Ixodes persulcatus TaxID=34615 RepID=A0AC60PTD0_IXOPE|nr:hypothetical protein HPB47_000412 [Ixodes persulcatus]
MERSIRAKGTKVIWKAKRDGKTYAVSLAFCHGRAPPETKSWLRACLVTHPLLPHRLVTALARGRLSPEVRRPPNPISSNVPIDECGKGPRLRGRLRLGVGAPTFCERSTSATSAASAPSLGLPRPPRIGVAWDVAEAFPARAARNEEGGFVPPPIVPPSAPLPAGLSLSASRADDAGPVLHRNRRRTVPLFGFARAARRSVVGAVPSVVLPSFECGAVSLPPRVLVPSVPSSLPPCVP